MRAAEQYGRLTTGNQPLNVRRKPLADVIEDARHTLATMITNWPNEYKLPNNHNIYELIEVMGVVAEELIDSEV